MQDIHDKESSTVEVQSTREYKKFLVGARFFTPV